MKAEQVKHTPGPWRVRENLPLPPCNGMSRAVIDSASRHCMAFLDYETKDAEAASEVAANAALIAAAPELLAVCQDHLADLLTPGSPLTKEGREMRIASARAAIAKALGHE